MVRVGIVGFGFMGRMHARCWSRQPGAGVTALCEKNLEGVRTSAATGNIAGAEEPIDLEGVALFDDFDALLASGTVDALSLTLPTFLHADFAVRALEAGLDVLCEKPMALGLEDCDRMIDAARRTGRLLQIGQCIRFWPAYEKAKELLDQGRYGRAVAASFRRLGALPAWGDADWFRDDRRSGGMALDLHSHDTDYIQWLFGTPRAVCSAADADGLYLVTRYAYDGLPVTAEGCWRMAPSFGFEMSFNLLLERATLVFDSTRQPAFRVCPAEGEAWVPELDPADGYAREIDYFARRVRGGPADERTALAASRETIRIVLAEKESARRRARVELTGAPRGAAERIGA